MAIANSKRNGRSVASQVRKLKSPSVIMVCPAKRPIQLRYMCPDEGRQIRISTGTRDEAEALRQKQELEAKLLLGISAKPKQVTRGANMRWEEFREEYSRLKVATFRSKQTVKTTESRLNVCEAVAHPRTLSEMASAETLAKLQAELRIGARSQRNKPRSPRTVLSYMRSLQAALNWAHRMKWLPERMSLDLMVDDDTDTFKGRPLTYSEFDLLLESCSHIYRRKSDGDEDIAESWRFLLRGLWESGLRLGEALNLSWDDDTLIRPLRTRRLGYLLLIPANMQKSRKSQEVPTTPNFAALLDTVPPDNRTGWIFTPKTRYVTRGRMSEDRAGHLISKIGKQAGVEVNTRGKSASAHDLRRSFGQRMADAGLPTRDLQSIMRHARLETTEKYYLRHHAVEQAERIARCLNRSNVYPEKSGTHSREPATLSNAESP